MKRRPRRTVSSALTSQHSIDDRSLLKLQKWSCHPTCLPWAGGSSETCRCQRDNGHHQQWPCRERGNALFPLEGKSSWILNWWAPSQQCLSFLNRRQKGWCLLSVARITSTWLPAAQLAGSVSTTTGVIWDPIFLGPLEAKDNLAE